MQTVEVKILSEKWFQYETCDLGTKNIFSKKNKNKKDRRAKPGCVALWGGAGRWGSPGRRRAGHDPAAAGLERGGHGELAGHGERLPERVALVQDDALPVDARQQRGGAHAAAAAQALHAGVLPLAGQLLKGGDHQVVVPRQAPCPAAAAAVSGDGRQRQVRQVNQAFLSFQIIC